MLGGSLINWLKGVILGALYKPKLKLMVVDPKKLYNLLLFL